MEFRDENRTACIVASGPSAARVDVTRTAGWPTVAVNDGYRIAGHADHVYAADARWWDYHAPAVRAQCPRAQLWTCTGAAARRHGLNLLQYERGPGLSVRPGIVRTGGAVGNSGAQAINLAYLLGARRLVLIGFDMGEQGHYFGDHPPGLHVVSPWERMRAGMATMAAELAALGVQVVNCSPLTAITYWPRADLPDVLP